MNKSLIEALQNLALQNPFDVLVPIAYVLAFLICVIGWILSAAKREDSDKFIVRQLVVTAFAASIPLWTSWVHDALLYLPYALVDYHTTLQNVYKQITAATNNAVNRVPGGVGVFSVSVQALMDLIVALLMRAVSTIGSVIAIPLLFVQILLSQFLVSMMPTAVAFFAIPNLSSKAQGYITFWVSVLLWPLGFAVAGIMAGTVFTVSNALGTAWSDSVTGAGGTIATFLAPFTAALILAGGIVSTPGIMYSLCAHGGAAINPRLPSPTGLLNTAVAFGRKR